MRRVIGMSGFVLGMQNGVAGDMSTAAADHRPIEIVTAMYGQPGSRHMLDVTARLQDICGPGAQACDVFCSESSFGSHRLGRKPICRVTYRCGAGYVRSVEAWREETIVMRCPERREEAGPSASSTSN